MATKDNSPKLGKLIETGISVAKLAQTKAEETLRDVVHISDVQRSQMRELLEDAAKKSKDSSESILKGVKKEIEKQVKNANSISRDELSKISEKLNGISQEISKVNALRDELKHLSDSISTLTRAILKSEKVESDRTVGSSPSSDVISTAEQEENVDPVEPKTTSPAEPKQANRKPTTSRTRAASTPRVRSRKPATKKSENPEDFPNSDH